MLGIGNRGEDFVVDVDEIERFEGGEFFAGDDRSYGVADVAHVIDAKGLLILTHRENAVCDGNVLACEDEVNARMRKSAREIDFADARMWMRRTKQFAVEHSRKDDVVGVAGLPGDFGAGVDPAAGFANDAEVVGFRRLALR